MGADLAEDRVGCGTLQQHGRLPVKSTQGKTGQIVGPNESGCGPVRHIEEVDLAVKHWPETGEGVVLPTGCARVAKMYPSCGRRQAGRDQVVQRLESFERGSAENESGDPSRR
jgi:hypothetical protein